MIYQHLLKTMFGHSKVFLPVIHVISEQQAIENTLVARENGSDGVFLISHGSIKANRLCDLLLQTKLFCPGFWLGINCLDLNASQAIQEVSRNISNQACNGLWVDNPNINESDPEQSEAKSNMQILHRDLGETLYFGSVDFKYQTPPKDRTAAVFAAKTYIDIITTSGPGTGKPADLEKVKEFRSAIGEQGVLALASGVTGENIEEYLPLVDVFLVASGISKSFSELDPSLVFKMAESIRAHEGVFTPSLESRALREFMSNLTNEDLSDWLNNPLNKTETPTLYNWVIHHR